MNGSNVEPPPGVRHGVPTLTEVVEWPGEMPPPVAAGALAATPGPPPAPAPLPTEDQLTRRVLADVQVQIDLMLDYRLREVLTPLLARAADSLVRDARQELASTLRDMVARAVDRELSRHRSG